jgi:phage regulator Rha-like protein
MDWKTGFEVTNCDFKLQQRLIWILKNRMDKDTSLIPLEIVERKIYNIRNQKVMLSVDLASLYEVEPRTLIQAVKRNIERFPSDFMFQLSDEEAKNLKSQFVISSWGGARSKPYAFTEQGVAMLSSVLRSQRAIQVNIAIMRAFVSMRETLLTNKELSEKVNELEKKYDKNFKVVFDALRQLTAKPGKENREIGYRSKDIEKK